MSVCIVCYGVCMVILFFLCNNTVLHITSYNNNTVNAQFKITALSYVDLFILR